MEFETLISTLSPETQTVLRQLFNGGAGLSAAELIRRITFITWRVTGAERATIWRALMWLANAGRISLASLVEAAEILMAEGGATVVAEAGAAAGGEATIAGGAAAGGFAIALAELLIFILALLLAMEAIAIAYYAYIGERDIIAKVAPQGRPCAGTGPSGRVFTKKVWRFGSRTSRNAAISEAMAHARSVMTCSGSCGEDPDGPQCSPVAITISVIPESFIVATRTTITYKVGCACI